MVGQIKGNMFNHLIQTDFVSVVSDPESCQIECCNLKSSGFVFGTTWNCFVSYGFHVVLYDIVWYGIVLYLTILHGIALIASAVSRKTQFFKIFKSLMAYNSK